MTKEADPRLSIRPARIGPQAEPDLYEIRWQIDNLRDQPAYLLESWLPHSQFFSPRQGAQPPIELPARSGRAIRRTVRVPPKPGLVVENAFLNLRIEYLGQPWRVLVRMRAERSAPGSVSVSVEAITAHRVGFAEETAEERP